MMPTYLDYAGSTPIDPKILEVYNDALTNAWANPSSIHRQGHIAKSYLENSRIKISKILNCDPKEIIFTSTATESNNLGILGVISAYSNLHKTSPHILISPIEHSSIWEFGQTTKDYLAEYCETDKVGFADIESIINKIKPETCLVNLMMVNNEIGTIQPINQLAEKLKQINYHRAINNLPKIYLHCDAVQAPNYLKIDLQSMGVDLLTLSSHKLYSPKGAALLYIKSGTNIDPVLLGGAQEKGIRVGTQNVPAIVAFAEALSVCTKTATTEAKRLCSLRDLIVSEVLKNIQESRINGFWAFGDYAARIANNAHFSFKNIDQESLLTALDLSGFYISAGSGCHSGSIEKSHVLKYLNQDDNGSADLRITLGRFTNLTEVENFTRVLINTIESIKI